MNPLSIPPNDEREAVRRAYRVLIERRRKRLAVQREAQKADDEKEYKPNAASAD
jgi:hypothetical protein